MTYVNLVISGL